MFMSLNPRNKKESVRFQVTKDSCCLTSAGCFLWFLKSIIGGSDPIYSHSMVTSQIPLKSELSQGQSLRWTVTKKDACTEQEWVPSSDLKCLTLIQRTFQDCVSRVWKNVKTEYANKSVTNQIYTSQKIMFPPHEILFDWGLYGHCPCS